MHYILVAQAYLGVIPGQPVLPALNITNEQQYFLSAAQVRDNHDDDDHQRDTMITDVTG